MARDFPKDVNQWMTLGVGGIGSLVESASAISIHAWVFADTFENASHFDNIVFCARHNGGISIGLTICNDGGGSNSKVLIGAKSQPGETFQEKLSTSDIGTSGYVPIGGVLDFGASFITPYINGVSEGAGSVSGWGSSTYLKGTPTGPDLIGGFIDFPGTTDFQFDGRIAEVAIWKAKLSASNFAALASGSPANFVMSSDLKVYMKLLGDNSPEKDSADNITGTISGTILKATHPNIRTFALTSWQAVFQYA